MDTKTFIIFAAEAISENMNYLTEPMNGCEIDGSLDQNEQLMAVVRVALLDGVEPSWLDEKANELMGWNITAWADSDEFTLHELANSYLDGLENS